MKPVENQLEKNLRSFKGEAEAHFQVLIIHPSHWSRSQLTWKQTTSHICIHKYVH